VQALPPRQLAVPWIAVAALAGVAWAVTVMLARKMGNGPGTMGLARGRNVARQRLDGYVSARALAGEMGRRVAGLLQRR